MVTFRFRAIFALFACFSISGGCPPPAGDDTNENGNENVAPGDNENGADGNENGGANSNDNSGGGNENENQNVNQNLNENDNNGGNQNENLNENENDNTGGDTENHPPVIEEFIIPETATSGEPVTIRWRVSDPDGDPLLVVLSTDSEYRDDYLFTDPAITSQSHTFTNARFTHVRVRVLDGRTEAIEVRFIEVQGPISIGVQSPVFKSLWDTPLRIKATVDSLYELRSVEAILRDRTVGLVNNEGSMDLEGLSRGYHIMDVRATDIFDNVAEVKRSFYFDKPPTLSVTTPTPYSVWDGQITIRGECSDDSGDACTISIRAGNVRDEFSANGAFERVIDVIDVTAGTLQPATVFIRAGDEWMDHRSWTGIPIIFYSSADFSKVFEAPQRIVGANRDRVLCATDYPGPVYDYPCSQGYATLQIVDRATGAVELVTNFDGWSINGFESSLLTPTGAFFAGQANELGSSSCIPRALDWNQGTLTMLGPPGDESHRFRETALSVAGDYGIWRSDTGNLFRRRFSDETNALVEGCSGSTSDVTADGDVVYADCATGQIHRYHNGGSAPVTADAGYVHSAPRTDGLLIVYTKSTLPGGEVVRETAMHDGSAETVLSDYGPHASIADSSYAVNGGWVAFLRNGPTGQKHVWLRSPTGDLRQLTFFTASSQIRALGPNGEVIIETSGVRRLASPDGTLRDLGPLLEKMIWIEDEWHLVLGAGLFRLVR